MGGHCLAERSLAGTGHIHTKYCGMSEDEACGNSLHLTDRFVPRVNDRPDTRLHPIYDVHGMPACNRFSTHFQFRVLHNSLNQGPRPSTIQPCGMAMTLCAALPCFAPLGFRAANRTQP